LNQDTRPILLIFHEKTSTGGCIPLLLNQANILVVRTRFGETLPKLHQVKSVIYFGGSSSVNTAQKEEWFKAELKWMENALKYKLPMFNICLGAQMLAHLLGAKIKHMDGGAVECGYYPLTSREETKLDILHTVYQWHNEQFDLPSTARCLATGSPICPIQAFDYENALAVQFHPEVNMDAIKHWGCRDAHELLKPNAQPLERHLELHPQHNSTNREWLKKKILPWLGN
jgi:GMP synthase (glutamine-hydrolysing)